eukprot:CAMPEP_0168442276 /NCGR_PEP_ID=MMETSP0228-20121227/43923_1 /TAXON_ID=133427 /ORGANISM="Protoceratium reticulatum, Strain CCCM 535 (=CCMP 1889)" /LENGTH=61 /DNA_ID=CAMNT_0008456629 /DNA_START=159 /DNA_END=340 /DNA_ORIENTATION=+
MKLALRGLAAQNPSRTAWLPVLPGPQRGFSHALHPGSRQQRDVPALPALPCLAAAGHHEAR